MSVSNGSPQACRFPMGHVGIQWGMLVSNGACWSPMGHICHRGVSDNNNITVNSFFILNIWPQFAELLASRPITNPKFH